MLDKSKYRLSGLSGGVLLSLLAHGLIVAVLLIDLPDPLPEAEPEEQVVAVTLVPPPEPEPEAATEPEAEAAPEPEPEAEPEQPEPEEAAPEPEVQAPEEEPAPEEPAPEAVAPEPPAAEADAAEGEGLPIPVLRPVFQFGEEDTGPEIAPDGGASEAPVEDLPEGQPEEPIADPEPQAVEEPPAGEPAADDVVETLPEPAAEPETEVTEAAEQDQQPADTPADQPPADPAPALAMPDDITLPDAELAGDTPGALAEAASETELASLPEDLVGVAVPVPQPKPANPATPDTPAVNAVETPAGNGPADTESADTGPARDNGLPGVRQLSSSVNTGHTVATTAMRNMPRDVRGSQLCTTELREQLRRAPEPYQPELLPSYELPGGTVLAVPKAAFRAGGAWYDLDFRCTVDADALRVVDFSFKVGNPIPRSQWQARGFPAF
ncbi:DUF930 domain-containing protein [uncultured Hoeflea sp.]|uniref:DUF930 domain-containing protein n=1 Tax=uncultured Hoeflea sp. TaxID=538666 RepID=UPI0030D6FE15